MKITFSSRKILWACAAGTSLALTPSAWAQEYPTRSVSFILPFPAGGGGDTIARLIASKLSVRLNKPFVVENKPGATGLIGISSVLRAPADGHTLLFTFSSAYMISPQLRVKSSFDPLRDFEPITIVGRFPFCLIVNSAVPANNIRELVNLAKQNPGALNFGTNGEGSVPHLLTEMLKQKTGTNMVHVPYKGGPLVNTAIAAGDVQMYFDGVGSAKQHIDTGRVKAIAVTGLSRTPVLPDVPTFKEAGIDGIELSSWMGIFAPKGTPDAVVQRLYKEIRLLLDSDAELKQHIKTVGLEVLGDKPADTALAIRSEYQAWKEVIDRLNIRTQ